MQAIITTILHRPYVFMFLIAYLILGRIYWGWRKTFLWLIIGYVVAWASEVSSIHNGFPYGLYYYKYENLVGELMVAGVPFWDSLSYPFMIFAGYTTAKFILTSPCQQVTTSASQQSKPLDDMKTWRRVDLKTILFGAFLTMLLDIIIDPLTVMGSRWFLGDIYYYPNGGQYFGVPITNFAGWFLVPLVVILAFQLTGKIVSKSSRQHVITSQRDEYVLTCRRVGLKTFLNPLFYLSIALFNICITIWIREYFLASIDCLLLTPIVGLIIYRTKRLSASVRSGESTRVRITV